MKRPNVETLWNRYRTPPHVRAHCRKVADVGKWLAEALKKRGETIDIDAVEDACLLHDVVRVVDFNRLDPTLGSPEDQTYWKALRKQYQGWHHADAGADILKKEGHETLAQWVKEHRYSALGTPDGPSSLESKIVYYADKRVAHTEIRPLLERLEEGRLRHFPDAAIDLKTQRQNERVQRLEAELFQGLNVKPDELAQLIQP